MSEVFEQRLSAVETSLRGKDDRLGLIARVEIMWRSWVWLVALLAHVIGIGIGFWIGKAQ